MKNLIEKLVLVQGKSQHGHPHKLTLHFSA